MNRSLRVAASVVAAGVVWAASGGGDDLSPGTRGTALTVLEGNRTEEIPVTFLGTFNDFGGPGYDLHLVRLEGPVADDVGVAAGMSGSPVYVDGRLIGAMSYRMGSLPKKAVAGVTPVEIMLDAERTGSGPPRRDGTISPIATPLVVAGLQPEVHEWIAPRLGEMGFVAVAGGEAASDTGDALGPGSPVGAQLVRGDMSIAAIGTVTWIDDDKVYAFGHPFLGSGRTEMPMVAAEVIHTLADLAGSVKMANVGVEKGVIVEDRWAAVVGRTGRKASMIPMELVVSGGDYGDERYEFEIVKSPEMAPLLAGLVVANTLQTNNGYSSRSTLLATGWLRLRDLPDVPLEMAYAGSGGFDPALSVGLGLLNTMDALVDNPFADVAVDGIEFHVQARNEVVQYYLEDLHYDRKPLRSGQTLEVRCVLREFQGETRTVDLALPLPDELGAGRELILAVGSPRAIQDALGTPLQQRARSASDLPSLARVLSDQRSAHRLTAVIYEPGKAVVSRGAAYVALPPTAERLLATQASRATRRTAKKLVSTLSLTEAELDGPVAGGVQLRLRFDGALDAEEEEGP